MSDGCWTPIEYVWVRCSNCDKADQVSEWLATHGGPHECDKCQDKRHAPVRRAKAEARASGLAKLTPEERAALGIREDKP